MIKSLLTIAIGFGAALTVATARLPAPNDEAKAKAAEAAAKTAHAGKVDNYKLCVSMNKVASFYGNSLKASGKALSPTATPDCADPGPYVSAADAAAKPATPPTAAPAAAATPTTKAAVPAAPVQPKKS